MKNNTIVTIGDINYLWGIFMLLASARKAGMDEPFLVGAKDFTPEAEEILTQLGGVTLVKLDGTKRPLETLKASVMLKASTEYATWADSDGFFTGNVSDLLAPTSPDLIQFRMRSAPETPDVFRQYSPVKGGCPVPELLEMWRKAVADAAGSALEKPRYDVLGTSCFLSLSLARHRKFVETWEKIQAKALAERDAGLVSRPAKFYHMLDESMMNACLYFVVDAPLVQEPFRMDKDRSRLFAHFIDHPKPWLGAWPPRSMRFFDEYVAVVEWAVEKGYRLPGGRIPAVFKRSLKTFWRVYAPLTPWVRRFGKLRRRLFG